MSEWKTIETAPKDGTDVLIAGPEFGKGPAFYLAVAGFHHDYWREEEYGDNYYQPTHWMPLPAPPDRKDADHAPD